MSADVHNHDQGPPRPPVRVRVCWKQMLELACSLIMNRPRLPCTCGKDPSGKSCARRRRQRCIGGSAGSVHEPASGCICSTEPKKHFPQISVLSGC